MRITLFTLLLTFTPPAGAGEGRPWYAQGDFTPEARLEFSIDNPLDVDRQHCPVVIRREDFPLPDIHEMWITVVDPEAVPFEGPSEKLLALQGGHQLRAEVNGHAIFHQLDDLDKDGIWDELFFQVDMKAKASMTIFIYLGENIRGWNKHFTHAGIGSYCRHLMPFWESENVGWKIWFANCCDVFAKRRPVLMSHHLYMENLDGYGVSLIDEDWGSDIQGVAGSLGGGGICLFEFPDKPDVVSLPRFTPAQSELASGSLWNAGQISDTRYAYEVVVNGPVRSIIRIKGMNWHSGNGFYEYEQLYTVFARQSYCTSRVTFTSFFPKKAGVMMGCGIRKKPEEDHFIQEGGMIISSGPEGIRDPEKIDNREDYRVDFIGTALVVKDQYMPVYQYVPSHEGNHTFRVVPRHESFEYLLASAWSEGAVYNNFEEFTGYIRKTQQEYNHPLQVRFEGLQKNPDHSVRYLQPVFEHVEIEKDITFAEVVNHEGESQKLRLDVYKPAGDRETDRPAILWIHGGGFRYGNDKTQGYIVSMASRFARRGYVCVSMDYRVRENPRDDIQGTLADALEDAMSGLDWLRDNSEQYHIDRNRIIVGGGSAGGIIAVNLCFKDGHDDEKWDKDGIIGHVNLWGVPDRSLMPPVIDGDDPPTIIVHGTEDTLVPFANSERLIRELEMNGVKCELIPIKGEGHTPAGYMDDFEVDIARFLNDLF